MIVAIDGPAGAGKSTIAQRVARALDFQLIDTGAIYRTLAWRAIQQGCDLTNPAQLADLASALHFDFRRDAAGQNTLVCDGQLMGDEIRTPHVSLASSQISSFPAVRQALLQIQRDLGERASSVLEGRDIGTVVFPHAEAKIFLTASDEIRAQRRLQQMQARGEEADFQVVLAEIVARDRRDTERDVAPLRQAPDAVAVDTSQLTIDQVVAEILAIVAHVKKSPSSDED